MGYLISETTREEREQIVAESLGYIDASCDGCMSGLVDMYQDYIDEEVQGNNFNVSAHEIELIKAYRNQQPSVRSAIDRMLEVESPAEEKQAKKIG